MQVLAFCVYFPSLRLTVWSFFFFLPSWHALLINNTVEYVMLQSAFICQNPNKTTTPSRRAAVLSL